MIAKGLHAAAPVEHKAAGAGLGLYLVASLASALDIQIERGVSTVITFVIDPAQPGLRRLAIVERAATGAPTGPARRLRSARARRRVVVRSAAIAGAVAAVAGGVAIYMATRPPPPPPPAILVLASEPYDAGDYIRDYDEFLKVALARKP